MRFHSGRPVDLVMAFMLAGCLAGGTSALAFAFDARAMIGLAGGLSALCWVAAGGALIARGLRR